MNILVTGAAGFIGSRLAERLLEMGHRVRGIDSFTDYYPRVLKEDNLGGLRGREGFELIEADILEVEPARLLEGVDAVVHLAAQAGVRRSWGENFAIYTQNNLLTTQRLLEAGRELGLGRLVYASSSSVYGDTRDLPMRETSACWPVSPYGVTKLAAEHLCGLYHKNFGVDTVSLRYFTVYGPRQRPDMAFHRFIPRPVGGWHHPLVRRRQPIAGLHLRGRRGGRHHRRRHHPPRPRARCFNVGGGSRVSVNRVIAMLEELTGRQAQVERLAVAKGDVRDTEADCGKSPAKSWVTPPR